MTIRIIAFIAALSAGAVSAPALGCGCKPATVELLSSHFFRIGVPSALGLRLPMRPSGVRVIVGSDGAAVRAKISSSSGDRQADAIAMRMALRARYRPARDEHCRAVVGTYLYVEDWQRNGG